MDNLNKVSSGTDTETSGSQYDSDSIEGSTGGEFKKTAYDKHLDKILKEKKNATMALHEAKSKLSEFENRELKLEEEKLLKEKQFETVIENYKKKLTDMESELKNTKTTIQNAKINSAIMTELKKLGFADNETNREIAGKLINRDSVIIDHTTNAVLGADDVAKGFYQKYSNLGLFGSKVFGVNHHAPANNSMETGDFKNMKKDELVSFIKGLKT